MWSLVQWWRDRRAGATQRNLRRAPGGTRRDAAWLRRRPFSDRYDGDDARYGYLGVSLGSGGYDPEDDPAFVPPPVPPHPRARGRREDVSE